MNLFSSIVFDSSRVIRNVAIGVLMLSAVCSMAESSRVISVNPDKAKKDLSHSYLGANAQQFRSHYSIKKMLKKPEQFSQFLLSIGSPVLRMDGRSVYGWFSPEECLKLREANIKFKRLKAWEKRGEIPSRKYQPGDYEAVAKKYHLKIQPVVVGSHHPNIAWFDPIKFHQFCRENNIRIIGAISDYQYYDPETGKVICFKDRPEYFDGAVKAAMKKISWVKEHVFLDLYVAWEIGNESFTGWDPILYAQYAKKIVAAALKIQPDIKLSVPTMVRDTDDPFIRNFIKKLKAHGNKNDWFGWHKEMLPALGDSIKKISYITAHVYGAKSRYNANAKGLGLATSLEGIPNTDHLRYLVTEWRYTGVGGTYHRTYAMGALWNAKFAMLILSNPKIDYSTVHEFLCTSGLGYWTPGKGDGSSGDIGNEWVFQYKPGMKRSKKAQLRSLDGKPAFDVGPFGPVNRMLNDLIRDCPLLIQHKSDYGPMSSAKFADGLNIEQKIKTNGELDWLISTIRDRSILGGVIVNTLDNAVKVSLNTGKVQYQLTDIRQMTCPPDMIFTAEVPGKAKLWKVENILTGGNKIILPPNSITSFRAKKR